MEMDWVNGILKLSSFFAVTIGILVLFVGRLLTKCLRRCESLVSLSL